MEVIATAEGYFNDTQIKKGTQFTVEHVDQLSDAERKGRIGPGWMKVISCTPEERKLIELRRAGGRAATFAPPSAVPPAPVTPKPPAGK